MTIDDIKNLVSADESRTLELKKTTGELKDGMHSACAFLNTEGGWLIFGVAPKSLKIIGQEVTDKTQQEIAQALAGLEPAVDVRVAYVDVPERPGNQVIAMHFDGWVWGERPHTFHGCPYYKVESTTKVMPQDMYDERIRAHQPQMYAWERLAADGVTLADLDENLIRNCIRRGIDGGRIPESALYEPTGDILSKWKLLKNGVPTNGAVLLFSNNIDEYPQFTLRMARFVGTNKNMFRDNQRAEGNFFKLLDAGVAFCFKHLSLSGRITNHSLEREEHLEVPYHALREALINALCHRHWEKYNLTISLAIYDDRIEIASPGTFPPQITAENIKEPHESYPHNLKVAEALYRMTYLENWGSGARRIMDACKAQNIEEPTWCDNEGFITITFKRPADSTANFVHGAGLRSESTQETVGSTQENAVGTQENSKSTQENAESTHESISQKILRILSDNPSMTLSDVASEVGSTRDGIRKITDKLRANGCLIREGSTKSGRWIVVNKELNDGK